jgi:hypothetical protein
VKKPNRRRAIRDSPAIASFACGDSRCARHNYVCVAEEKFDCLTLIDSLDSEQAPRSDSRFALPSAHIETLLHAFQRSLRRCDAIARNA